MSEFPALLFLPCFGLSALYSRIYCPTAWHPSTMELAQYCTPTAGVMVMFNLREEAWPPTRFLSWCAYSMVPLFKINSVYDHQFMKIVGFFIGLYSLAVCLFLCWIYFLYPGSNWPCSYGIKSGLSVSTGFTVHNKLLTPDANHKTRNLKSLFKSSYNTFKKISNLICNRIVY